MTSFTPPLSQNPGQNQPQTWKIKDITVTQDADASRRVWWTSDCAVDVDGANGQNGKPFAYRLDDKGLDLLANAGYPSQSWRNVLIDDGAGHPQTDGHGNCYSSTTFRWPDKGLAQRYVDAATVPYLVVNSIVRVAAKGIVIGCKGQMTWRGVSIPVVVADVSGPHDLGEASMAAVEALLRKYNETVKPEERYPESMIQKLISPRRGGIADVLFEFWPGQPAVVNGVVYPLQRA